MALPVSGPISKSQVNVELGRSSTAQLSMNDAEVRMLAGKKTGAISMSDLHGKRRTAYTLTAGTNGFSTGWSLTSFGSLAPTTFKGSTINALVDASTASALSISFIPNADAGFLQAIRINSVDRYMSDMTKTGPGWQGAPEVGLVNGGGYTVYLYG